MPPETPPEQAKPDLPAGVLRELAGLLLLVFGVVVLDAAAFWYSPKLGVAVLGGAMLAAGTWLSLGEA